MTEFVRKNLIIISGTFTAKPGQTGTPSTATAVVRYTNLSGATATDTIAMTHNADGSWSASWDSSLTKGGTVDWVASCAGGLQAAAQGSFTIKANGANTA